MTKEAIDIKLIKNGLDIVMELKVAPEIEQFFKEAAKGNQTELSEKWRGADGQRLEFYRKVETMSRKVENQQVMDNFGNGLFDVETDRINVALIRTVGASNGITIKTNGLLSYAEMEVYIRSLAIWVKGFYEEQLRPAEVKARISVEVGN